MSFLKKQKLCFISMFALLLTLFISVSCNNSDDDDSNSSSKGSTKTYTDAELAQQSATIKNVLTTRGKASATAFKPSYTTPSSDKKTAMLNEDLNAVAWRDESIIYYYSPTGEKIPLGSDASYLFEGGENLEEIDLTGFDTSDVTSMYCMFLDCKSLRVVDLSNFDTSKVTNMGWMFARCYRLEELDVSKFNTSNVTSMYMMFHNCSSLTSLDVSKFDTCNVTKMTRMFHGCSLLTSLDVSNFDTNKVTDMSFMFYACYALKTIYTASDADWSSVIESVGMFNDCRVLKGGNYTFYSPSNKNNATYARVDKEGQPGYFTPKTK